jgi:dolichyl-phosphate-mannose--protein O-mannosyl transferase
MGIYYYMSYNKAPLIKTLIPLGLSGVFFGLGAASKWICIYAGMGLAVIFFATMIQRLIEYMYAKNEGTTHDAQVNQRIIDTYKTNTVITLLWCVIFFIAVPVAIYVASYIPIMKIDASKDIYYVLDNQKNMFNYHSGLNSTHSFASKWYEWPFIIKPMWFYSNDVVRGTGYMGSIATFGNPAVWWVGVIGMIYLFIEALLHKKIPKEAKFIFLAFLAQFLPWTVIGRSTFIYHYFASVPFIILSITYSIRSLEERYKMKKFIVFIYLAVVILLFVMFYPVLTGTVIPSWYGQWLKWMPTWWFFY